MASYRTPLVLIGGFLGAGKTTLLRSLVTRLRSDGLDPHVILNDYGNAEIDASSLEMSRGRVTPIAGSCICCGSQAELIHALRRAPLQRHSAMLLEANGTADTTEIIELLTADRRVGRYTLPVQAAVVDAARWQRRDWNDRLERVQVQTARFVHLTRLAEVSPARRRAVEASIRTLAPRARFASVDEIAGAIRELSRLADSLPPRRFDTSNERVASAVSSASEHEARHHFSSLEVPFPDPVDEGALRKALSELSPEVLRIKGIVRLKGRDEPVYVQRTDRPGSLDFFPVRVNTELETLLVLIGVGLDARVTQPLTRFSHRRSP
ncbi:CobW family GTP-binding protein [Gaopeijia maritima]|uniref:GTP-binding protein n=1 Tax=Gaopeijia maritima TaxID=3119007 RepID=A0ABU9EB83_9BACT